MSAMSPHYEHFDHLSEKKEVYTYRDIRHEKNDLLCLKAVNYAVSNGF